MVKEKLLFAFKEIKNCHHLYGKYFYVLIASGILSISVYNYSWKLSTSQVSKAGIAHVSDNLISDLNAVSEKLENGKIGGSLCKVAISSYIYEIKKDRIRSNHRTLALYSNLTHTTTLFLTILSMIIIGFLFSIFQMATAGENKNSEIEIEMINIKLKTGYVSIAVSVISVAALSFYLSQAHEIKEIRGSKNSSVNISIGEFLEACEDYTV